MDYTSNSKLQTLTEADSIHALMEAVNYNAETLDGFPIPIKYGSNSNGHYVNFSNGVALIWIKKSLGTNYPCKNYIGGDSSTALNAFYRSNGITVPFPETLADSNPVVVVTVDGSVWPDMTWQQSTVSTTNVTGNISCRSDDSAVKNVKTLNVIAFGRWK